LALHSLFLPLSFFPPSFFSLPSPHHLAKNYASCGKGSSAHPKALTPTPDLPNCLSPPLPHSPSPFFAVIFFSLSPWNYPEHRRIGTGTFGQFGSRGRYPNEQNRRQFTFLCYVFLSSSSSATTLVQAQRPQIPGPA